MAKEKTEKKESSKAKKKTIDKDFDKFIDEKLKFTDYTRDAVPAGLLDALAAEWAEMHPKPKTEKTE